jgi:hypothetical protein
VRFLLSASLHFALRASLRLFEIVPDDFTPVLRVVWYPPARFSTNCEAASSKYTIRLGPRAMCVIR